VGIGFLTTPTGAIQLSKLNLHEPSNLTYSPHLGVENMKICKIYCLIILKWGFHCQIIKLLDCPAAKLLAHVPGRHVKYFLNKCIITILKLISVHPLD